MALLHNLQRNTTNAVLAVQRQRPGGELDEGHLAFFLPGEAAQQSHHPAIILSISRAQAG